MGLFRKIFTLATFGAGATVGLLFSTKSGKEVRQKMAEKKNAEEKAQVLATEAKEAGKNIWETLRPSLMKLKNELQKELISWKEEAKKDIAKLTSAGMKQAQSINRKARKEVKKERGKISSSVKKKVSEVKRTILKKRNHRSS